MEKKLQELMLRLNGYGISVNYITRAGNNLANKYILVNAKRIEELINRPELLMTKSEYNQYIKQQSRELLEKEKVVIMTGLIKLLILRMREKII